MQQDHVLRLIFLSSVGLSLLLAGGSNTCFRSARLHFRILFSVAASSLGLIGCWFLTENRSLVAQSAGLTAIVLFATFLVGSEQTTRFLSSLVRLARQPRVRWGLVSALGVTLLLGSVVAFEKADQASITNNMRDLEEIASSPPMKETIQVYAKTDRGNRIVLREPLDPKTGSELDDMEQRMLRTSPVKNQIIRNQPATELSNCHGWVFTGGRYWVLGAEVEPILAENDYKSVEEPQPGDLVIYRDSAGVSHSGIVRYVTKGLPVMVEGKWGKSGVYLHAVDQSCYGKNFTYYRSSRNGHLLAGVDDPTSNHLGRNATSE